MAASSPENLLMLFDEQVLGVILDVECSKHGYEVYVCPSCKAFLASDHSVGNTGHVTMVKHYHACGLYKLYNDVKGLGQQKEVAYAGE